MYGKPYVYNQKLYYQTVANQKEGVILKTNTIHNWLWNGNEFQKLTQEGDQEINTLVKNRTSDGFESDSGWSISEYELMNVTPSNLPRKTITINLPNKKFALVIRQGRSADHYYWQSFSMQIDDQQVEEALYFWTVQQRYVNNAEYRQLRGLN